MDYREFRQKIESKFTVPSEDLLDRLVHGLDSIHFIIVLANIKGDWYKINVSENDMMLFLEILGLVESRGAKINRDFFVSGNKYPKCLTLEIHTTHSFLSQEDVPSYIKQYWMKND